MRINLGKKTAAVALGAVALTGTGVAYAYWTTTGGGSGSATTAATVTSTLSILGPGTTGGTPAISGALVPIASSPTQAGYTGVSVIVKNTGSERQALSDITPTFEVVPATGKTCAASNFDLVKVTNGEVSVAGMGASTAIPVGKIALVNSNDNQDGCKGATINFTFTAATPA